MPGIRFPSIERLQQSKKCVRCAGPDSEIRNCKKGTLLCSNCVGGHTAAHKPCPVLKAKNQNLFHQKQQKYHADVLISRQKHQLVLKLITYSPWVKYSYRFGFLRPSLYLVGYSRFSRSLLALRWQRGYFRQLEFLHRLFADNSPIFSSLVLLLKCFTGQHDGGRRSSPDQLHRQQSVWIYLRFYNTNHLRRQDEGCRT